MKRLILTILLALALPTLAQTTRPVPKPFIGVWFQPTSSFQKWHDRGITVLVGIETEGGTVKPADYVKAAHTAGFYVIGTDPSSDALQQPDEPDTDTTTPAKQPPALQAAYKAFKVTAPTKPVFISFSGTKTQWRPRTDYVEYAKAADWLSYDDYLANGGAIDPTNAAATQAAWDFYATRNDFLLGIGAGKQVFSFIECSDQDLRVQSWLHDPANQPQGAQIAGRMRAPTPDEMEQQVSLAIQHGATGIIYFPQKIGLGWESFDGVTPDLETRMKLINARLAGKAVPETAKPTTLPATDPFAGTVITLPSGKAYKLTPVN